MKIEIRQVNDEEIVHLSGYINAVGRESKLLTDTINGQFVEVAEPGVFRNSLEKNPDIPMLLNHNHQREIGRNGQNVVLREDSIGLKFEADINDKEVIELAKNNKLVGCSFGFTDIISLREPKRGTINRRTLQEINLQEVSILSEGHMPAYYGTLVEARTENEQPKEIRYIDTDPLYKEKLLLVIKTYL